ISLTRGKSAKYLNSTSTRKGRWSLKEIENLKMAIRLCGKEATPKELSQYIPSRDHTQIRKYIDKLKISGDFNIMFPDNEDVSVDEETFGINLAFFFFILSF